MLRTAEWVESEDLALGWGNGVMLVVVGVVPVPGGGDEVEVEVDPGVLVEGARSSPTRPK
jgi:hypothetical protein